MVRTSGSQPGNTGSIPVGAKIFMKKIPLFQAIATLFGTIIGAGILGIPYVFQKAGFLTATIMLAVVAFAMVAISLMFGEIILRTHDRHQISGYVEKYLGKFWKKFVSVFLIIGITGSLLAYFIGLGDVLSAVFGGLPIIWAIIFYFIGAIFLYFGIRLIKNLEFILTLGIVVVVFIILLMTAGKLNFTGIFNFNLVKIFLPYGVILFACSDLVAIPEAREILIGKERLFKKAIFWGSFLPALIYLIFAWLTVSVTGSATTPIATVGLGQMMGNSIVMVINLFAFFTIFTSLLTLGLALKEMYDYDFKLKHHFAWFLTVAAPLFFYFLGLRDFIEILSLVGALGFGLNGLVYVFAYWQARKIGERQPEYALSKPLAIFSSVFLPLIFLGGLIYTLLDIF